MKNIYVNTGDLSGRLLDSVIDKMETAKKKMGYNYSADAYLEVAIGIAKYDSPTGRLDLFNSNFAEMAGSLGGDIEEVWKKLQEYRVILDSGPDALVDIDKKQKNEITNWWTRTSYRVSSFFDNKGGTGEETVVSRDNVESDQNELKPKEVTITKYTDGCNRGSIRYVSQSNDLENNGWIADNGNCWTEKAGGECGYASQSMALSYVGIDFSPGDMCDGEYAHENAQWHTYWDQSAAYGHSIGVNCGIDESASIKETLINRANNYKNDAGKGNVSPVAIHYTNTSLPPAGYDEYGNPIYQQHSVLIIDYNAETGVFTAIDPASNTTNDARRYFTIDDEGRINGGSGMAWTENGNARIDGNVQYLRGD